MHKDVSDLDCCGTFVFNKSAGSPDLWDARGFWSATDRQDLLTLRKLRAVRLLLTRSFADEVSDLRTERFLLHEDNQAMVSMLNSKGSASKPLMSELRKLRFLPRVLVVELNACWIPSAVKRFEDSLPGFGTLGM